jgi:hypothetical protein
MGKQILFHMLPSDCEEFLAFLQRHDPIVITAWSSESHEIHDLVASACGSADPICLWNQPLLPHLERKLISGPEGRTYYRTDQSLPVLELSTSHEQTWDGKPALTQGRVWGSFANKSRSLDAWFKAISRWIRANYAPNPLKQLGGYIAPAAFEWHIRGGILLPMLVPPVNAEWGKFVASQHERTETV